MCGIFSLVNRSRLIRPHDLASGLAALGHRGPDGTGMWISTDGHIALGHTRLSIVDLAGGAQPLHCADDKVHLIINGEIYGYRALRRSLEQKGCVFKTNSDSEVALHLYRVHGLDFIHHLRGEFALVLVDETQQRIVAARDRFGIKPLCYTQTSDGQMCIASEAKAIFAAGAARPAWDLQALHAALSLQYTPVDRTVFQGVAQLPPGHMLVWQEGAVNLSKYWDIRLSPDKDEDTYEAEWRESFFSTLSKAVHMRLEADVSVCAHLSGGIDSASIAVIATQHRQAPIDCFTVRFDAIEGYDEYPIAKEMAAHIEARLHTVDVTGDSIADNLSDAVYFSEGVSINSHLVGKYLLNRAIAAAGFKVALSGEGADELLAGYPHLREDMLDAQEGSDAGVRQALYAGNARLAGVFLAEGEMLDTKGMTKHIGFTPSFLRAKASLGLRLHALMDDDYVQAMQGSDPYADMAAHHAPEITGLSRVDAASHLWIKSALANYILRTLGDGCEMPHAVEGRVPFLDHNLFELCRRMPLHMKIRGMREKHILREAMRPYLTDTLYNRQKHPFIAPPAARMLTPRLRDYIADTLASDAFARLPFFDRRKVATWYQSYEKASDRVAVTQEPVLMTLLTTAALQDRYGMAA